MTATINYNILGGTYYSGIRLDAIHVGGNALVMDDLNLAQAIKEADPKSIVVHRSYHQDDSQWFNKMSPQDWINSQWNFGNYGMLVQCHNEPVVDAGNVEAFVDWNFEMLRIAHATRLHIAVGGFSVGNPDTHLIESGAFDKMLLAMDVNDALNLHEYFIQSPTMPGEYGYLCGRLEFWLKRMVKLGCRCKTIVVGEYGRDLGGGINDGWRGQGWDDAAYGNRLLEGMEKIYQPLAEEYGFRIAVNVFCAGTGYGNRWQSFNIENDYYLYKLMLDWNIKAGKMTTVYGPGTKPDPKEITQSVNFRRDPNGAYIRTLQVGDRVTVYQAPVVTISGSPNHWQRVTSNGVDGWVANDAYDTPCWKDVSATVITLDDVINAAAHTLDLAQKLKAQGAVPPPQPTF